MADSNGNSRQVQPVEQASLVSVGQVTKDGETESVTLVYQQGDKLITYTVAPSK